ncbi:MAG: hypothetical protein QM731_02535 [Chitinophagaceae bacterium]
MKTITTILCLCLIISFSAYSQCTSPSAPPVIACGTGTALVDGASINTGEIYNASSGTYSNITLNGGTLVLCGNVSFNSLNFNSGTMLINAGTTINFPGSFNAGNGNRFYNFGNVSFSSIVNVTGSNTVVYNAAGATITMNSSLTILNDGLLINNGTISAGIVFLNGGAHVCLGPGSQSNIESLFNNEANSVTVPTGTACVSYTNTFNGNAPISSTSNLHVCELPGAAAPDPVAMGSATFTANCASCNVLLPLKLLSFKAKQSGSNVGLEWKTTDEENVRSFIIEQSKNGQSFEAIGEVTANNKPSTYSFTTSIDADAYFRLKMTDIDGKFTYSQVIVTRVKTDNTQLTLVANPVTGSSAELTLAVAKNQTGELILIDNMGRSIKKMPVVLLKGGNTIRFDMNSISNGQYYIYFIGGTEKTKLVPVIKR